MRHSLQSYHMFPLIHLIKFNADGIFRQNIVERSKCQVAKPEELKTCLYADDEFGIDQQRTRFSV